MYNHRDVVGIRLGPHGHVVGIDEALGVEEGQDYLVLLACMGLGFEGARLALSQPLLTLLVGPGYGRTPWTCPW